MTTKVCIKCHIEKTLTDFPNKKSGKDGHSNTCRLCNNAYLSKKYKEGREDKEYMENKRKQSRESYVRVDGKRLKYKGYKAFLLKFPEKISAHKAATKMRKPGFEAHHWSYLPEHNKSIIYVTKLSHSFIHRHTIYDQERMQYRRCDNSQLLDSREAAVSFYRSLGVECE